VFVLVNLCAILPQRDPVSNKKLIANTASSAEIASPIARPARGCAGRAAFRCSIWGRLNVCNAPEVKQDEQLVALFPNKKRERESLRARTLTIGGHQQDR
jgi:hypothetical protein